MTSLIRRFALVICILAFAAQASAEVVLVSQSRSVSGDARAVWLGWFGETYCDIADIDSIPAPDFGLFEEGISVGANCGYGSAFGSATQNSEVQTGYFSIHGSTTSTGSGAGYETQPHSAYSHSYFEVVFEVSTPTPFSLIGSMTTTPSDDYFTSIGEYFLNLDLDGAHYLHFTVDYYGDYDLSVSESGILQPGTYTLTVSANSISEGWEDRSGNSSSFDFEFVMETGVAADEMGWGQVKAMFR